MIHLLLTITPIYIEQQKRDKSSKDCTYFTTQRKRQQKKALLF
jgi:hypothetical protein